MPTNKAEKTQKTSDLGYCISDDIIQRLGFAIQNHERMGRPFLFVGLTGFTKNKHDIPGWMAITGEDHEGKVYPLSDIFTGWEFQNYDAITEELRKACSYCLVLFKKM